MTACAAWDPRPGPIRAMEPRPNPPASRALAARAAADKGADLPDRIRRHRWLARFWSELTPAQQRRVAGRMADAGPEAAQRWDVMGLEERARLVFGDSAARGGRAMPAREAPGAMAAGG
ncbi:hypothetical protein CKO45_20660 [Paracraurococcus ruber]|uniref:DUF3106 domain-containing protein n=2 Tax=Paracraurococcus ruber TaxID=77675 RepID=A0ABS1D2B2_9PROT|nr:hypothetical protein [Paracraurococcus ruber]